MKGLILLFLCISIFGIGWGYLDTDTRTSIKSVVRKNLFPIVLGLLVVAVAIFLSVNTTLRLV